MSWYDRTDIRVHVDEPEQPKPVLYDAKGKPLTWATKRQPIGFRPPESPERPKR